MTGIYRNDRPALLFTLPVWAVLPWIATVRLDLRPAAEGGVLYTWITAVLQAHAWSVPLVGAVFTMIIAAQCVFLANDADLSGRRGYLPVILLPLLLACFPQRTAFGPELLAMPFVLLCMRRLWLPKGPANAEAFNTGSLLGLASVVHFPFAFLLLAISSTASVLRPFRWRDHLLPLFGLLLVRYIWWALLHLYAPGEVTGLRPLAIAQPGILPGSAFVWSSLGLVAMLVIAAFIAYVNGYRRSVMHGKNMRSALLAFAVCCALLAGFQILLGGSASTVMLVVPFTLLLTAPLAAQRRQWLSQAAFLALLAMALWAQFGAGLSSPA